MAPRKDQMRIIRQDAGFSAKLGFGGPVEKTADFGTETDRPEAITPAAAQAETISLKPDAVGKPMCPLPTVQDGPQEDDSVSERLTRRATTSTVAGTSLPASPRGQVVYVAVSLTARQAILAEIWARTARCSTQFLIRRVAQGLRDEVFEEWALRGMPEVNEPRGLRGIGGGGREGRPTGRTRDRPSENPWVRERAPPGVRSCLFRRSTITGCAMRGTCSNWI